ncbi:ABC transporter substrate-binding protein [Acidisoma silvae]|uniref:ABC transporter substrate-binding protein n=1 Tax=Acidisoma silvae TaxID=2802396 RepID=A0A963YQF4_9PROT|nr:ABC transporter substrate-binding protein [Acidisoma silvae]MCB8875216.1 ABC transporter substrate-binding protein [Acidisoma silvae]
MLKLTLAATATLACGLIAAKPAAATTYPLTVTDTAGRTVTIQHEPKRLALQDGRDMMMLALLDRTNPTGRVKVWNNLERRDDTNFWKLIAQKWPAADAIPDMGFSDDGEVNMEQILAAHPDLVIAERRTEGNLESAGVMQQLAALHIPLIFVDSVVQPVVDAPKSVTVLGEVLNREAEAKDYTDFYAAHLAQITKVTHTVTPKARVFVEALAGRSGPDQCCFTHGHFGWGALLDTIGVVNIGGDLLHSPSGDVTLETVLAEKPDVYVMTGSEGAHRPPVFADFGYDADNTQVQKSLARLEQRPGFAELAPAQDGRVWGIWHQFYSHPFNIVGLEYLAKFAYPKQFADLDPAATYREIITRFTDMPVGAFTFASKAPPVAP